MDSHKWQLPLAFGVLGFLFSSRKWIFFMNSLNPLVGMIVYYIILIFTIGLLEYFGLIIAGIKFESINQTIGTVLIIFSFFILVNWESCYINMITQGNCNLSNVYLQSEDGAVYYLWSKLTNNINLLRILTFVITPVLLTFIGQNMITGKITIAPF